MEIPSVPDFFKPLSLRVCKILDNIGANDETRRLIVDTSITRDIIFTFVLGVKKPRPKSMYIFGSSAEGTRTVGMYSDVDYLVCHEYPEVFQNTSDAINIDKRSALLMVKDKDTRPGYTKLQLVEDRVPLTRSSCQSLKKVQAFDSKGRVVVKPFNKDFPEEEDSIVHGPAGTSPATRSFAAQDFVHTYRCRSWSEEASEWLTRPRKFGWPPEKLIEEMKPLGFFMVPVGHPHSSETDLEWRISLSLQERLLMFSLNSTQFKCYILLKFFKKDIVNKKVGEESISSYHCKTCLFYMIENTPGHFWQPQNLLACFQGCLNCIRRWVINGDCPNYFIVRENMFERRISVVKSKLQNVLGELLTDDNYMYFLLAIQCDDFGKHLANAVVPRHFLSDSIYNEERMRLHQYVDLHRFGMLSINEILTNLGNVSAVDTIETLFKHVHSLSHADNITEHTKAQTRKAALFFLTYLESSLVPIMVVNYVLRGEAKKAVGILLSSKWEELSSRADSLSVKLKQSALLYVLGYHEASEEILTSLEDRCNKLQISWCNCKMFSPSIPMLFRLIMAAQKPSYQEFINCYFVSCVTFLQSEKEVVPVPLAYEMIRSVHMPSDTPWDAYRNPFSPEWAVVDGKIFLYFMLFLHHSRKNLKTPMSKDIIAIEMVLMTDKNLVHRETALNIVGWCHKGTGNLDEAMKYFCQSLALQKNHNAAFWHILVTLCELVSREYRRRLTQSFFVMTRNIRPRIRYWF